MAIADYDITKVRLTIKDGAGNITPTGFDADTRIVVEPAPRSAVRHSGINEFGYPWSTGGGHWCMWCGQGTFGPGPYPSPDDRCRRCNAPWPRADSWRSSAYVPRRLDRILRPLPARDRRLRDVAEALGLTPVDYIDDMQRTAREEVADNAEWLVTMGAHAVCVALDDLFAVEAHADRMIPATAETYVWLFGVALSAYENNFAHNGWQRCDATCEELFDMTRRNEISATPRGDWRLLLGLHSGGPVLEVRYDGANWVWTDEVAPSDYFVEGPR